MGVFVSQRKTSSTPQRKTTTADDAFFAFMVSREAEQLTPSTLRYYRNSLTPFVDWCKQNGNTTIDTIAAAHVRAYLVSLQRRHLAPNSIHGAARAIRAFLRFCAADEIIDAAPKFAMPKVPKAILPAFTAADVALLLDACLTQRDRCIVLMLLDTGLRAAEFVALNGGDIDIATGTVQVRGGKGSKDRTAYLGARTRRELGRYWRAEYKPATNAPAWINIRVGRGGDRLTDNGLRQVLRRIGERAGVEHSHPHTYRRSFALMSLRSGMSVFHLQRLMGHEDISILRQYLALLDGDIQQAHAEHGPIDKLLPK